jgi:hypothetical protein
MVLLAGQKAIQSSEEVISGGEGDLAHLRFAEFGLGCDVSNKHG